MQPMVNLALRAARNAGQDLVRRLDRFDAAQSTDQEKAKFVADCAINLEKSIIFELKKSYPDHQYVGRETGGYVESERAATWHICVIDELANFRSNIPSFAIIITHSNQGKVEHAVITNPMNGDEFSASKGRGSYLNNRRIRRGDVINVNDAIIAFTLPANRQNGNGQKERIVDLMDVSFDLHNIGSNVLSLCYVAANRFQGAVLSNVDDYALKAGGLVATEAGCLMADANGKPQINAPANVVVSNPKLLKALIR